MKSADSGYLALYFFRVGLALIEIDYRTIRKIGTTPNLYPKLATFDAIRELKYQIHYIHSYQMLSPGYVLSALVDVIVKLDVVVICLSRCDCLQTRTST